MDIQQTLNQFPDLFKSITLSTIDDSGEPLASYAPYIKYKQKMYIIISASAKHFHNIQKYPNISVMMLEDESHATSIFFRKRLVLQCRAKTMEPNTQIKQIFVAEHGDMVSMLLDQLNFYVVELEVNQGTFVIGPGKAYEVNKDWSISNHIKRGHSKKEGN